MVQEVILLHLLKKNKVSIYDIPIVSITEQYFEYMNTLKEFDIEYSSEFVVIAAELLYIKSKMLLKGYDKTRDKKSVAQIPYRTSLW